MLGMLRGIFGESSVLGSTVCIEERMIQWTTYCEKSLQQQQEQELDVRAQKLNSQAIKHSDLTHQFLLRFSSDKRFFYLDFSRQTIYNSDNMNLKDRTSAFGY